MDAWSVAALHQIWLLSTGVTCLVNYTTAVVELNGVSSWSTDVYDTEHPSTNDMGYDVFRRFDDPRRFKVIDIVPLDRDALEGLAEEMNGACVGQAEINRIYEASGGNPLYAVELVKTLMANPALIPVSPGRELTDGNTGGGAGGGHVMSSTADMKTKMEMNHRVEEIICFRLDKLASPLQTVLKAAAVAASNGKAFDAVVISFILQEHDYFAEEHNKGPSNFRNASVFDEESYTGNNMTQVEEALEELVSNGDFIRFVVDNGDDDDEEEYSRGGDGSPTISGAASMKMVAASVKASVKAPVKRRRVSITGDDEGMESTLLMEFKIPVEQATIYGLIVDEQKEYFHERVALYCIRHMSLMSGKSDDTNMIEEEAFHWEHSSLWSRALSAYLKLADIERRIGHERAWLQCIYRAAKMYKFMEEETCAIFPFEDSVLQDESLVLSIIKNKGDVPEHITSSMIDGLERELDAVYDVFAVDMLAIPKVARLYVDLVNIQMFSFDDIEQVTFAMGVALKLYVACNYWPEYQKHHTRDDGRFSSAKVGRMMALNSLQVPTMQLTGGIRSSIEERLMAERHLAMKTTDAENHELLCAVSMVKLMYHKFSNANQFLSKTLLDTTANHLHFFFMEPSQITAINNVKILELITLQHDFVQAEELLRLRQHHRTEADTKLLVRNYNMDYGNYLQAHLMQYALLGGVAVRDSPTMRWFVQEMHSVVRIYKHGPSIAWLLLSLLPTLVHIHEYGEAMFFMDVYVNLMTMNKTIETLPPMLLTIFRTWVVCMQDLAYRNHIDRVNDPTGHELLAIDNIEAVLAQIDSHPYGIRLCEESLDGITLQLDNFMFNCGCSLEFIALSLAAYLMARSANEERHVTTQNGFIKRLDVLSKLIQYQDQYGSALNVMNTMMAFRLALTCNEQFPGNIVRSSVADGFTYRLFSFIEAHMKLKMYHTVSFLADFALNYLHANKATLTPSIVDKYRTLMAEAEARKANLPPRTEPGLDEDDDDDDNRRR